MHARFRHIYDASQSTLIVPATKYALLCIATSFRFSVAFVAAEIEGPSRHRRGAEGLAPPACSLPGRWSVPAHCAAVVVVVGWLVYSGAAQPIRPAVMMLLAIVALLLAAVIYLLSLRGYRGNIEHVTQRGDLSPSQCTSVYKSPLQRCCVLVAPHRSQQLTARHITTTADDVPSPERVVGTAFIMTGDAANRFRYHLSPRVIGDKEGLIVRVGVDPAIHGRGLGALLMRQLVSEARSMGLRTLVLTTSTAQRAAIHLYVQLGFRVSSLIPMYELLDFYLVEMELDL